MGRCAVIRVLDVVVPARNEEALIGACLRALLAARAALRAREPAVRCRLIVALDSCTDATADVVAAFAPDVEALSLQVGNVGRSRSAAVDLALCGFDRPREHWICSTDADSAVPETWLLDHLAAAREGALLALGSVRPRHTDLAPGAYDDWLARHATGARHVFGANLGVRADAYLLAGGFPSLRVGEDVALAEAVEALDPAFCSALGVHPDAPVTVSLPHSVVLTSGRLDGRTPGGFAGYLRTLVD